MYRIERHGAIKYICENGVRITRGHHEFKIGVGGCIIGILGSKEEVILTPDIRYVDHIGFDGFMENERIHEQIVTAALNGKNSQDLVERPTSLQLVRKALGIR